MIETIQASFADAIGTMVVYIPKIIGAIIILIVGLFAGRILGKVVSRILDKVGVDDAVDKTAIGDTIKKSGITTVGFFDALIRWFIYLIFVMAAVNVLNIPMFTSLMQQVVLYIPHLSHAAGRSVHSASNPGRHSTGSRTDTG
jgi:small-conductance mechanosensitive channel